MPLVAFAEGSSMQINEKDSEEEDSDDEGGEGDSEKEKSEDSDDDDDSDDEEKKKEEEAKKSSSSSAKKAADEKIKKHQSAISDAESEKSKLQSGMTDVKKILASLQSVKKDLKSYVSQLDTNLSEIEAKLDELDKQLVQKQEEIEKAKAALAVAKDNEAVQYASMKQRVRFMYEKRNTAYLEVILSAKTVGDFLNKAEYISKISDYDQKMLQDMIDVKNEVENLESRLEQEEKQLEQVQAEIKEDREAVETLIAAKQQEIKTYDSDINNKEQLVKEYEDEIAAQNAIIRDLEAAIAAEKKKLQASNGKVISYDGGQFKFPAPSFTRVSDDYGNRIHPTLGVKQFHNGVDLAAPSGSPILAAYDGSVIAAAYSSTMGNYIMIDHGDGLFTIYMHASSLAVSTGQSVSKGDRIGSVGSTGRSTGPHLHFSVRLNGEYVSPWNYLKQ